ncbi:MAG TPA: MFS transporter [Longimicrobiales bacterium]
MSGPAGDVAGAGTARPRQPADEGGAVSPWRLVSLLLLVASAGYVCRTAVTVAGPGIMADFHLSQAQLGTVFSAFLVGYTLCQVPSGWLADRVDPRKLFLALVLAWTVLTAGTALVPGLGAAGGMVLGGLPLLLMVRALFGVSAAPTYPASARTIGVNLPGRIQGSANGAVLASIGIGSALTPLAVGAAVRAWGWRPALLLSAALAGVALLAWWAAAPRNLRVQPPLKPTPPGSSRDGVAGGDAGAPPALASLARSRSFWCLVGSYTLQGYLGYIFVFWFYLYLVQVRHFEVMRAAAITALPWVCTLVAIPLGGALSDAAVRRFGATLGRRLLPLPALLLAGGFLVVGARAQAAWLAVTCLTLCTVLVIGTEGPFWATLNQVARRHGGTGGGIMNFGSNLGGMISPVATPWLAERIGWAPALSATAVLALLAGALWLGVRVDDTE